MRQRTVVAVYIDLENVSGDLSLQALMDALVLADEPEGDGTGRDVAFAVKAAFGRSESIAPLRQQLLEYNYAIHETPHIAREGTKNRADLVISVSAFETLYLNNPPIQRYVFITSDADFTVIMDCLRKYGKEVWLVARKADLHRRVFNNSCDRILAMEDLGTARVPSQPEKPEGIRTRKASPIPNPSTDRAICLVAKVLLSLDLEGLHPSAAVGIKLRQLDRSLDLNASGYRGVNALLSALADRGLVEVELREGKNLYVRVRDQKSLATLAASV